MGCATANIPSGTGTGGSGTGKGCYAAAAGYFDSSPIYRVWIAATEVSLVR